MRPPDKAERRPRRKDGVPEAHAGSGGIRVTIPRQPRSPHVCPRCGGVIAWTDLEALRRCAELAREAS